MAMEGKGPAEELGLTESYDLASDLGITEPAEADLEPMDITSETTDTDGGDDDNSPDDGGNDKIVKLRD